MKTIPQCLLAVALAGAIHFSAHAAGPAQAGPVRVADTHRVDLRLDGRDMAPTRAMARPLEIRTADAAFIKIRFEHFNLPRGVTLEVGNPAGTETYRYSKTHRDGFTWDRAAGDDGRTRFSAMSITGPVAVLRLVGAAQEPWTSAHRVRIKEYLEGFPEALLPELQRQGLLGAPGAEPLSICGVNDKQAVACYVGSDDAAVDRSRPVAKMLFSGSACTAWRVGPDNRMFTNNHCASSQSGITGSEFWFNYQRSSCTGAQATVVKVAGDRLLETQANLDFTLFTVKNFDSISQFGYLGLDVREPQLGDEIFISGHPGGA